MQLVREETPLWNRQLRLTLVQGVDTKYYLVTTIKYYSFDVVDGRPNYEVSVTEVDEKGNFKVLVQPHRKTFIEKDPSVKHHQFVLDNFDSMLKLAAPPPPPPKPASAAAPAAAAPAPKSSGAQAPKSSGAPAPKSSGAQAPKSSGAQAPKSSGAQAPKSSGAQAPKSSGAQAPKSSAAPPADPAKS